MPRPPKLNPEVQQRIVLAVRVGSYLNVAAAMAGISEATVHRWMADPRPAYRAFQEAVRQARAEAEVAALGMIMKGAAHNPGAALKLLERRHPERWGRGRADLERPSPEFPGDIVEPQVPAKPKTFMDLVFSLRPEWVYVVTKLIAAAKLGHTPEQFFEGGDRLANLRETGGNEPPPSQWWRRPGEGEAGENADPPNVDDRVPDGPRSDRDDQLRDGDG